MNYAQIREMDISNSIGISASLFVCGCYFNCKNCFNKEFQSFDYGKEWTKDIEDKFIELGRNDLIDHFSILGGEPLEQGEDMLNLVSRIKNETNKPIFMWTGYKFENLSGIKLDIVKMIDVLIDGQFEQENYDIELKLRGSKNQRVIDIQKSLKEGSVVELQI